MINFRLIRHLWLFLAVAEEQHFGRAAKRLGMAQPPLTAQIKMLEHALRIRLFERSRRGTKLTPEGAAILPAVRMLAEQLERLELSVREVAAGRRGLLTIGAIGAALVEVLPRLIERLKRDSPEVTVSIREIDSVAAVPLLETGDIDLAFARLEGELGTGIQSHPLKADRLAVALPRDHPLATKTRIRLAKLADADFVMFFRHVSPNYFDSLMACCHDAGFSPRIVHEVNSVASQVAFVACGQGVALVPLALKKLAPASVVIRPLAEKHEVVTLAVAWNPRRTNQVIETALKVSLDETAAIGPRK